MFQTHHHLHWVSSQPKMKAYQVIGTAPPEGPFQNDSKKGIPSSNQHFFRDSQPIHLSAKTKWLSNPVVLQIARQWHRDFASFRHHGDSIPPAPPLWKTQENSRDLQSHGILDSERKKLPNIEFFRILLLSHRIHGTSIFTYIYHKNQSNVGIYVVPYVDPMGLISFRKNVRHPMNMRFVLKKNV